VAAISVTLNADVFDVTIACAGANCSIAAKSSSLVAMRSGAASMMKSASASAAARSQVRLSLLVMAVPAAAVSLPRSTPPRTISSIAPRPLSTASCDTSNIIVS
jgi:hypothetical protein